MYQSQKQKQNVNQKQLKQNNMQGPGTEKQARVGFILILCIFASLIMCGVVSCVDSNSNKNVQYKYALGDVILVKPDSLKATISQRYTYGPDGNGDNGIRYEIQYYDKEGNQRSDYVKEFQIFSKQF